MSPEFMCLSKNQRTADSDCEKFLLELSKIEIDRKEKLELDF